MSSRANPRVPHRAAPRNAEAEEWAVAQLAKAVSARDSLPPSAVDHVLSAINILLKRRGMDHE